MSEFVRVESVKKVSRHFVEKLDFNILLVRVVYFPLIMNGWVVKEGGLKTPFKIVLVRVVYFCLSLDCWVLKEGGQRVEFTASLFSVKDVRQCCSPIIDFFAPKYIIDCRKNGGKKILLRIFSPDDVSWR